MGENFRGESLSSRDVIERDFGIEVARAIQRLQKDAEGKNFESLMHTLRRIMASEEIGLSEEQFDRLTRVLSENKRELGLDSESK